MNDMEKELSWLESQTKFHDDNPALKDAFEQIDVIRTLMGVKVTERKHLEDRPQWEKNYWKLMDQADADGDNPAIAEAWEKYQMLKSLVR